MSAGLFPFVQFEFGFLLGPEDGRYLGRSERDGDPELVVVVTTVGAPRRRDLHRRRPKKAESGAGPEPVPTNRATLVEPKPFDDRSSAETWLKQLKGDQVQLEERIGRGLLDLNAVLSAQRAATMDPYVRDVGRISPLVTRVGFGSGDEIVEGHFGEAIELRGPRGKVRRRELLVPQEKLAAILGKRHERRATTELVLRARLDILAGRPREAALQTRIALEAAIAELPSQSAELSLLREETSSEANRALDGDLGNESLEVVIETVDAIERALRRDRGE